jgi:hypothetical protein
MKYISTKPRIQASKFSLTSFLDKFTFSCAWSTRFPLKKFSLEVLLLVCTKCCETFISRHAGRLLFAKTTEVFSCHVFLDSRTHEHIYLVEKMA